MYEVSSEIYAETDFAPTKCSNGRILSSFKFFYPIDDDEKTACPDNDGDFQVSRKRSGVISIEHSASTVLNLVGLQVWRGALLLADFFFEYRREFYNKQILELGAGVGLTSIAVAMHAEKVVCTDVNRGGILELIQGNVQRNEKLLRNSINVLEFDFTSESNSPEIMEAIEKSDVIFAADVIYDDDITDAFIKVMDHILNTQCGKQKTIYIGLEKRYVFTISDLDSVAPCFEYFMKKVDKKPWTIQQIPLTFRQYFAYERCKDLVLLKVTKK